MKPIVVLTTIDSEEDAQRIATALVERKLAACVQISRINSVYTWEDEVQSSPELRLVVKTTDKSYAAVEDAIRELHTYDLPAIIALPVEHAYEPFAEWIAANSTGG